VNDSDDQPPAEEPTVKARAHEPGVLELGLRLGYAVPMGSAFGNASSSMTVNQGDLASSRVPLGLDVGYRLPRFYLGFFFQVGFLSIAENMTTGCGPDTGVSCGGYDITLGGAVAVHFAPDAAFDPWLGLAFGYEWLMVFESSGGMSAELTFKGPQFVTFEVGGDIKTVGTFRFGPFASLSVGQYQNAELKTGGNTMSADIPSQTIHEWLTFGVRGVYDFGTGKPRANPD
jgi:hypothetical protein